MPALRQSLRSLLRARTFSVAVVASLGAGIGAVACIFSIADAVLFRALPYPSPGDLVFIGSVRPQRTNAPFSLPELVDYSARARTVRIAGYTTWNAALATTGTPRRLQGMRVSANTFDVLGVTPAAGRLFNRSDDAPGAAPIVVLSHRFWRQQFGGRSSVVGETVRLNEAPYRVVGVLPAHLPLTIRGVDVVVPLQPDLDPRRHIRGSTNFLLFIGRLEGSIDRARAELNDVAASLRAEFPAAYSSKIGVALTPLQEYLVGSTRASFVVLLGAAGLLLAIALANVLNLFLVRGIAKRGQVSLRRAMGATGWRLGWTLVLEAGMLVVMGAVAGIGLALLALAALGESGIAVPRLDEVHLSGRSLLLVVAVIAIATSAFAAVELLWALRESPRSAMASVGRGIQGSRGEARLRSFFLAGQVALATLLTIVTGTMARSFGELRSVDLGYRPDSVSLARISFPAQRYRSVGDLARFASDFEGALRAEPGVYSAGAVSIAPLSGNLSVVPFAVAGRVSDSKERLTANLRSATPGYLPAIGARLLAGRIFTDADIATTTHVAVVSAALVETYFAGTDPIGRQLLIDDNNTGPRPVTIIGVIANLRHVDLDGPAQFDVYLPVAQLHTDQLSLALGSQFWAIRSQGPVSTSRFAEALARVGPGVAMSAVQPMRDYVDASLAPRRVAVAALTSFAGIALLLAVIGAYGVVAYSAAQRTREFGVRLALGADLSHIRKELLYPALRLALAGVATGVVLAAFARTLVAGLLFGVSATDPATMAVVSVALLFATVLAAALPAWRASRTSPAIALLSADR